MVQHMSLRSEVGFYYNIKHVTGITHNFIGQTIIERTNQSINDMLNKQKGTKNTPRNRMYKSCILKPPPTGFNYICHE